MAIHENGRQSSALGTVYLLCGTLALVVALNGMAILGGMNEPPLYSIVNLSTPTRVLIFGTPLLAFLLIASGITISIHAKEAEYGKWPDRLPIPEMFRSDNREFLKFIHAIGIFAFVWLPCLAMVAGFWSLSQLSVVRFQPPEARSNYLSFWHTPDLRELHRIFDPEFGYLIGRMSGSGIQDSLSWYPGIQHVIYFALILAALTVVIRANYLVFRPAPHPPAQDNMSADNDHEKG